NVPASASQSITVTAGSQPPTAAITSPSSSLLYRVGDVINFSGSGADVDGSAIPATSLSWQVIVHHCPGGSCHAHYLFTTTGATGNFTIPDPGDDACHDLHLPAPNAMGLTNTQSVSIPPQTVTLTFNTVPTGLQLVYDGTAGTTPRTQQTVVNSQHVLYVLSPQ